jgi:hypothetical protein
MEPARRESADGEINSLLETVSHALADQAGKSVFALGGKIDLGTIANALSNASEPSPIVVRWDSGEINHCRKVSLPVVQTDADSQGAFANFLADSEPATYGVGSEAVFNETYRKAGKMNATRFSTNFNPYEHGVVDAISQALSHGDHRGIRAELYNLNVGWAVGNFGDPADRH